jgi:hypothetical protein
MEPAPARQSNITDTDVLMLVCEEERAEMLAEAEPVTYFRTPLTMAMSTF